MEEREATGKECERKQEGKRKKEEKKGKKR